jgi:hypothetical protein
MQFTLPTGEVAFVCKSAETDPAQGLVVEETDMTQPTPLHEKTWLEENPDRAQIFEALRSQLRRLVDAMDVGPRALTQIEQTARLGRELLAVGKDPNSIGAIMMASQGYNTMQGAETIGIGDGYAATATSAPAETFGTSLIRELVGAIGTIMAPRDPSPPTAYPPMLSELVLAIDVARAKGMTELVEKLEAQLLARAAPEEDEPKGEVAA